MNELTLLRTLREDVAEPSPDQLDAAFATLNRAMRGAEPRRRRAPRARWVLAAAGGAVALTLVGGNFVMAAESAHAASLLRATAANAITFVDPVPGPGEYLLSHTHADWGMGTHDAEGKVTFERNEQTIDVYMPADAGADWVLYRDWGKLDDMVTGRKEGEPVIRAKNGGFYDGHPWLTENLADIPGGGGAEVLAYFDGQYVGGSASRDEDNFVRITDILRSGLVPADLRAGMFEALALIPGVTSTEDVANLDGKKGVAIGRTEMLRGGERAEIIIEPATGLVIGERQLSTMALFGFGVNEVRSLTAIETSVAATAL